MVIRIEMNAEDVSNEVRRYSILVGFLLIVVFVVPCVGFALLSKYCQKQTRKRRVSVLSNKTSFLALHFNEICTSVLVITVFLGVTFMNMQL